MLEWWTRQQFGPSGRFALLNGLTTAAVALVMWVIASYGFEWRHLFFAACFGIGSGVGTFIGRNKMNAAFPFGLDLDEKMNVWRIVRNGGPVEDPADAPAVAHYAGWVLRKTNVVAVAIVGVVAVAALAIIALAAAKDDDAEYARMAGLLAVILCLALVPFLFSLRKWRRNAERALTASHAGTPVPSAENGSVHRESPAAG